MVLLLLRLSMRLIPWKQSDAAHFYATGTVWHHSQYYGVEKNNIYNTTPNYFQVIIKVAFMSLFTTRVCLGAQL